VSEHPEWCKTRDNPIAVMLWKDKRRPALLEVRCGERAHRLAKVYAADGKRWLCMPGFDFVAQFFEQGNKDHGDAINHMHAALKDLAALEHDQVQRCSDGTYLIRLARVRDALDRRFKTIVAEWIEPSTSHQVARGTR
jgi:hypothetical protein